MTLRPALGWIPTFAALAVVVATSALGCWQINRATQKQQEQLELEKSSHLGPMQLAPHPMRLDELRLHRVRVIGKFDPNRVVYLDSRVYHGVVGYQVLMPLRIGDSDQYVLVNRGWVKAEADRLRLPQIDTDPSEITVTGIAIEPVDRALDLSDRGYQGNVWQHLRLKRYEDRFSVKLQPVLLLQDNETGDGLVRDWPRPDLGIERHHGYAFQWFALAIATVVLYGVLHVRKSRRR
jgi:surfeit locus 1 family protein